MDRAVAEAKIVALKASCNQHLQKTEEAIAELDRIIQEIIHRAEAV